MVVFVQPGETRKVDVCRDHFEVMVQMNDTESETVEEFVTRMSASGQSVAVWVKADTGTSPRSGNATTARIAALLKRIEAPPASPAVVHDPDDAAAVHHGQTAVFTFDPITSEAEWWSVVEALSGGRTEHPNVVIHAAAIPTALRPLIDVCVTVPDDGGIGPIVRYRPNNLATTEEVTERPMAGLVGS